MKVTDWKKLVRPLLPKAQEWHFRGPLCYRIPVGWLLRGVLAEGSGFDQSLYVWKVAIPLFVPTDVLDLSFSHRVEGPAHRYTLDHSGNLQAVTRSALLCVDAEDEREALARIAASIPVETPNLRMLEVLAYALIIQGQGGRAKCVLHEAESRPADSDWEQEIVRRMQQVKKLVVEERTEALTRQFEQWRGESCAALGVR